MRIALTGVSGFIGSEIARQLAGTGHVVTGLVRPTSRRDHIEPFVDRFVVGDQGDPGCFDELLDGADAVIHNAVDWQLFAGREVDLGAVVHANFRGSLLLMERSRPMPFVFMSTIAVHHDMRPRWVGTIDEDHPTRPGGFYGAYKAAVEAFLWAEHAAHQRPFCALRPCAVYGIDPKLDRSIGYPIIQKIAAGQAITRAGGGKFVHVEDVAAATVAAVVDPVGATGVVNLADCYARWADWASLTAELLGINAQIDDSSPSTAKNVFTKDAARSLGVSIDRGITGIREHLGALIEAMREAGDLPRV